MKYDIIYADPPWLFINAPPIRWAGYKYPLMNTQQIASLPVREIASENSMLFLWTTWTHIADALRVIESWGFRYKTLGFIWIKMTSVNKPFVGMGYWTRANSESCLLAVRGRPKRVRADISQVVFSPRERHSAKPAIVREKIVQLCGTRPRVELFAREKMDGWDSWGNEINSDISL